MIKLNLISPEQKSILTVRFIYKTVENIFGILIITSIILGIYLLILKEDLDILEFENATIQERSKKQSEEITNKVKALNAKISTYNQLISSGYNWSELFVNLSSLTPRGVILNQFTASTQTKVVSVEGYASTRDQLIQFTDNLKNSSLFAEIESPLTNLLSQKDIIFSLQAKLIYD